MSWVKKNYEKAALGGAVLVGVGIAAMIVSGSKEIEELSYQPATSGKNEVGIPQAPAASSALQSVGEKHRIENRQQDGRDIWLFTGIDLHVNESSPSETQDLRTSSPVHSEIPNIWWLEHGIDIGFSNSPQKDHDSDGFSNLDEFHAETNPSDAEEYPEPIVKLKLDSLGISEWRLKWSEFGIDVLQWSLYRAPDDRSVRPERANVKAGEKVFGEFFEYVGFEEEKEENGTTKKFAVLKDFRPGKNGEPIKVGRRDENKKPGRLIENYEVSLALAALGQENSPFSVGLNEPFSLPYDAEAELKPYVLKSIEKREGGYDLKVVKVDSDQEKKLTWAIK